MTRETKLNLIFVSLIVALSAPGAAILFKKKLSSTRMMYLPDPVRQGVVYMNPIPAPAGVTRFVPPQTAGWVQQLNDERAGGRPVLMRPGEGGAALPVMSQRHLFQVTAWRPGDDHWRAWLLVWDPQLRPERGQLSIRAEGGRLIPGTIESAQVLALPMAVRMELRDAGFTRPPQEVVWVAARFEGKPGDDAVDIHLIHVSADGTVADSATQIALKQ